MKKNYVYEIVNTMGTIEYVGETCNPKNRWKQHTKLKPGKHGKFYNRADVFMNVVKSFDTKKESFDYQCELQKEYGLKTDYEVMIERQSEIIKIPKKSVRSILAYDYKTGTFIAEFNSQKQAAKVLMIKTQGNITNVLKNRVKQINGYTFQYKV